jgi:CDP-glycerol glycerophosphotransferase (TagB/SpsB family)
MRNLIFYLSSLIFKAFSIVPIKNNRIILECEYGKGFYGNLLYIYKEIKKQNLDVEIIIPLNKGVTIDLQEEENIKLITTRSLSHLYYLATSKYWITDNHYYQFLRKRKDTIMINTWHALGAFKKFGLHSAKGEDVERFKKDGENINYLLVSAEKLKSIYSEALNVPTDRILSLGIPRTDPLFDESYKSNLKGAFLDKHKVASGKKLILYAPTFRDNEKEKFNMKLDLELLKRVLGEEYLLLLKLHPIIRNKDIIPENMKDFVLDVNSENINDLMIASDILITDYSSVVFEYALLEKPMIFFAYDYDDFKENLRDFYFPYEEFVPGPIVKTTEDVIEAIKNNNFPMDKVKRFSKEFCGFVGGKSSERFVEFFLSKYKRR